MECREVKNLLSEFIDGVLSDAATARVTAHLDTCTGCAATYEDMTKLIGYMREMETVDEPDDLLDNVKVRLERPFSPAAWLRRLFAPAPVKVPAAATVIVIVAMLIIYLPGARDGEQPLEITISKDAEEQRTDVSFEEKRIEKGPVSGRREKLETDAEFDAVQGAPATPEVVEGASVEAPAPKKARPPEEPSTAKEIRISEKAPVEKPPEVKATTALDAAAVMKDTEIREELSIWEIVASVGGVVLERGDEVATPQSAALRDDEDGALQPAAQ
jgi:hypothetical protein